MSLHENACRLIQLLKEQHLSLITAESLTGGMIADTLVSVPGASAVIRGGYVTYQTPMKTVMLGVPEALISTCHVVSAPVAQAMAQGARTRSGADVAIAATGLAGPDSDESGLPVGTVFLGISTSQATWAEELHLSGDRQAIREATVAEAIRRITCALFPAVPGVTMRRPTPDELPQIERLTYRAFQTFTFPDGSRPEKITEHYLAHILPHHPDFVPELHLVAEAEGRLVGDIMYTRGQVVRPSGETLPVLSFGPLSVVPDWQKRGTGNLLVRETLQKARTMGHGAVIILGHPGYYQRFGFLPAREYGLTLPGGAAFDPFMALELLPGYLGQAGGVFHESAAFDFPQDEMAAWEAAWQL